ncbi:hypothetical protein K502DRAFT_340835 [Neoconidiobolus thromboides FSU 785]|nr:hypothetical protein K502DRAFT_340835 [Neoconidiobolus thromboides FSU 785]
MEPLLSYEIIYCRLNQRYYWINLFYSLVPFIIFYLPYIKDINDVVNNDNNWNLIVYGITTVFLIIKLRKSTSLEEMFGVLFLYLKLAHLIVFYLFNLKLFGSIYLLVMLILFSLIPQPHYYGPSMTLVLTKDTLNEFIDSAEYTILCLEMDWSPRCINMQPVLASVSLKYTNDKVKFGRINLEENEEEYSKKYKIDNSATSLQIPTLILFHHGKEIQRLPDIKSRFRGAKLTFWDRSEESIVDAFKLYDKMSSSNDDLD